METLKDYKKNMIRRCIQADEEGASKSCDTSPNARERQQETESGEGQASRIRNASPEAVIHLRTYYAFSRVASDDYGASQPNAEWR